MTGFDAMNLVVLPLGLGLLGFVEPCSIGSTLVFIKHLEDRNAADKLAQVAVFTAVRSLFIGLLGVFAVLLGMAFWGLQKAGWLLLGALYVGLGVLYLTGRIEWLMVSVGPSLARFAGQRGSLALGLLFGLNIPACAAPLVVALLAAAAAGVTGGTIAAGFVSLALFGFALSLPLVLAVLFAPARRLLDRLAELSRRLPLWTGMLLVGLGLWSIGFSLFAEVKASPP